MEKYEKYKDSGVEWIGNVPSHWKVKRLKFIGEAIGGLTYSPNDVVESSEEGKLVLRSSNIQNGKLELSDNVYVNSQISEKLTLKKGDILICSRNGSRHLIGKNIYIDERTAGQTFGAFMMIFRASESRFLYQYFNSQIFSSQSSLFLSATINQLTSGTLNNFLIAIPNSFEEQTAIADYLDKKTSELDTLITKKEKLIELLKEERTAIINQAVTKGLDPDVEMKDSGVEWLGEIPAHWEVKKLKHVFDSKNTIRVPLNAEERGNMENKIYDYYGASGIIDFVDNYLFDEETILIGEDGANLLTRSKRLAFIAKGKYWVNNHAHILKPKNGNIEYLCELLELIDYTEYVSGSAQPKLTQEALMSINIFEPPIEEQNLIFNFLKMEFNRIDTIIFKAEQEITLLKEYKTASISEVVTGKVKVV